MTFRYFSLQFLNLICYCFHTQLKVFHLVRQIEGKAVKLLIEKFAYCSALLDLFYGRKLRAKFCCRHSLLGYFPPYATDWGGGGGVLSSQL
jgi:hypothetical protein